MPHAARPIATWLAVFALVAQTLAFALHGPLRVLAGADGTLVICTAEGLKRIGGGEPGTAPSAADHVCSACATLAGVAVPPAPVPPTAVSFAPLSAAMPATHAALSSRPAPGPAQPRAPPSWT
jgi:hypothetical protein